MKGPLTPPGGSRSDKELLRVVAYESQRMSLDMIGSCALSETSVSNKRFDDNKLEQFLVTCHIEFPIKGSTFIQTSKDQLSDIHRQSRFLCTLRLEKSIS